jgi:hypothetical protein
LENRITFQHTLVCNVLFHLLISVNCVKLLLSSTEKCCVHGFYKYVSVQKQRKFWVWFTDFFYVLTIFRLTCRNCIGRINSISYSSNCDLFLECSFCGTFLRKIGTNAILQPPPQFYQLLYVFSENPRRFLAQLSWAIVITNTGNCFRRCYLTNPVIGNTQLILL